MLDSLCSLRDKMRTFWMVRFLLYNTIPYFIQNENNVFGIKYTFTMLGATKAKLACIYYHVVSSYWHHPTATSNHIWLKQKQSSVLSQYSLVVNYSK